MPPLRTHVLRFCNMVYCNLAPILGKGYNPPLRTHVLRIFNLLSCKLVLRFYGFLVNLYFVIDLL